MVSKKTSDLSRERKRIKKQKIDRITNSYMITLSWGIFVIILLRFVEIGYLNIDMVLKMPVIMKVAAAVLGLGAIGLFLCGKFNLLDKKPTFFGYSAFALVLAVSSLWLGFYADIRYFFVQLNPSIASVDSRWWISRPFIILTVIYLVVMLVVTAVKIALVERSKKA